MATNFIETYTGKRFFFEEPTVDMVSAEDIAHSLSMQCRFNGHCQRFYCPAPDQRILTDDLRWVAAGDLRLGDNLVGFDETAHIAGATGKNRRRFRPSEITHLQPVKRNVICLEMSDGSVVKSSSEHPWLVATKQSRNQKWQTTLEISLAIRHGRKRYMHKFMPVWDEDTSKEAGWLAGMYDGEGYLSVLNRGGIQLGLAQNPGLVLDTAIRSLKERGFDFSESPTGRNRVISLQSRGGWREMMRLCGSVRPIRLIDKFKKHFHAGEFDKQMDGIGEPLEIIRAWDLGEEWVTGIETSTHTYLCEGYGAHNSVAEHSVLLCMNYVWGNEEAYALLMHDAAEAYVADLPRPIKHSLPAYQTVEARIERVIAAKFNLEYPHPQIVKDWDSRIILDERAQCMGRSGNDWQMGDLSPLGIRLQFWTPKQAEDIFLQHYRRLSALVKPREVA